MQFRSVLLVVLVTTSSWAAAPPERVDATKVTKLIKRLDHDGFEIRQEADESLRSMGKAIVSQLKQAMVTTRSLEVRSRLSRMIHELSIDERINDLVKQLADASTYDGACWAIRKSGSMVVPLLQRQLNEPMPTEQRKRIETLIAELSFN